ncbi:MAG: hypothetical protein H0S79_12780 [Anaerolineaceae bacterium]|nr:hypothetical protein [Anaerolineaceae bacterium]
MPKEKPSDRIFVEGRVIEQFRSLTAQPTKNSTVLQQPFLELKDAFLWAVAMGVNYGKRRPLEGKKEGLFLWVRINSSTELPCLKMVALSESKDIHVLTDTQQIQQIAEEYANEGIRIIKERLVDKPGDPLFNLVEIIKES